MANIVGTSAYFFGTLGGTTKPNRVSWLFWTISTFIAAFGGLAASVGFTVIPVFVSATLCLLILFSSFVNPHAYWQLGFFDHLCGFFALVALVLWALTNNPSLAILFAIISDLCACIPTIVKAWRSPESESAGTYLGGFFNGISALLVLQNANFSAIAFPMSLVIQEATILLAIYRKKLL